MSSPRPYQDMEDLPHALPVFPLTGALLLPRAHLPLNIFEPRYLAMVDTALAGNRLIGMIQPAEPEAEETSDKPALSSVGCAGRLTAFRETEDGRYLITLTGICRFRAGPELKVTTPFRQLQPDFSPYLDDLHPIELDEESFPRAELLEAFKSYLARRDLKADWDAAAEAPAETLVGALATLCPFEPPEKQALLEAKSWQARVETLIALFEMSGAEPSGGTTLN
jgi:Lon protease-like protein